MAKKRKRTILDGRTITNLLMPLIFIVSLLFVVIVAITGNNTSSDSSLPDYSWSEGWIMEDGTVFSAPRADKTNDSVTIRKTLPEGLTVNDSVVFSSGYQPVRVEVDGKALPVVGTFEGRIIYATAYSHVSLSPDLSGKEMTVTFLNHGGKQWIEIYGIKFGDFNLIRQSAFADDVISIFSGTFLFLVAAFIFVLGMLQRASAVQVISNYTQDFMLASAVTAMLAVWILVDTETVTLMFGHNPAYVFVNIFAYLFIMGPWLMQLVNSTGKQSVLLRVLAMSGLIETVVIIVGVIFGFFDFSAYLTAEHLIGVGVESAIVLLSYVTYKQRKDIGSKMLLGAGVLLVIMSLMAGYTYYFTVSPNNVSFMKYGILSYIVVMLCDLVFTFRNINRRYVSEIEAARKAAVDANRAKSDFLSSMSHDIRTPMNAIMGLTTIASANIENPDVVKDSLRKIGISSRHLLGLINDILDMSKIESGKIALTNAEISLSELTDNLLNIIQPQIKSRRHRFDIYLKNISSEYVYCDGVRLNQILLNILSNAVKYTEEEGSITITLSQEESPKGDKWVRTLFRIEDTGIGMTPEFVEHIFDSFTRANDHNVHVIEGTGLGMSITKHLVDLMNGSISVESQLGEGSTFVVTLDFERVTKEELVRVLPQWNTLVVDDDEPLCLSAVATLKEMGINADYTQSGESAVEMVDSCAKGLRPYHVVLLDWQMPGMDGIETARRIRERVGDDVPILLITAYDWSEIEEEARAAGINGFLSKPLFSSTLRCGLMHYVAHDGDVVEAKHEEQIDFTGRRILLSEDNDINWEIAEIILSGNGFVVERAEDGLKCLEMFKESVPGYYDIILMDIKMPRMDGFESTSAIRALERPDAVIIPIIAMTANAFNEDIQHCIDVGMNGHIAKPIDVKLLLKILANFLK